MLTFMYLLVNLLELKECLRNFCRCLLNHVEVEMAAHTIKCLGIVRLFSSELLKENAQKVYSRFALIEYAWKAYNRFAVVECACYTYGRLILIKYKCPTSATKRSMERLVWKEILTVRAEPPFTTPPLLALWSSK